MRPCSLLACAAFALAFTAHAGEGVVTGIPPVAVLPEHPTAFERVNLRLQVDSCAFDPAVVRVSSAGGIIRVNARPRECLQAGTREQADVLLGAFPAGEYHVDIYLSDASSGRADFSADFAVRDPAEVAVVPAPPRPLTQYTGLWYDAYDPGWGVGVYQSPVHAMFVTFFTYDAAGSPEWYTVQGGRWTSSTAWTGTVYRTAMTAPGTAPAVRAAGSATLDFALGPGNSGEAAFAYTIDGRSARRLVRRMPF